MPVLRKVLRVAGVILLMALCFAAGWLAVSKSGLVQPKHWEKPKQAIAVVSTRGHCDKGRLTQGHTAEDYCVEGALPGWEKGPKPPADLILVIHGYNNNAEKARYKFDLARESLEVNGYRGAVAGFSWDADTQGDPLAMTGYHAGLRNADGNGPKLARFIADYKARCPDARLHLIGYSMGARVALEGLLALADEKRFAGPRPLVMSVHLVGAAVANDNVELGSRYGEAIQSQTGVLFNYYSREDNKLEAYFPLKEADRALGQTDIEHPDRKPSNFIGVDAQRELLTFKDEGQVDADETGDNHSGYLGIRDEATGRLLSDGVMDLVAGNVERLEGYEAIDGGHSDAKEQN